MKEDEIWVLVFKAQPHPENVPVDVRIANTLKFAGRQRLKCLRITGPEKDPLKAEYLDGQPGAEE